MSELKPLSADRKAKISESMKGKENNLSHGHCKNRKPSPTYSSWLSMRSRCKLTNRENSDRYSKRGVTVSARWDSFELFLQDMGERPDGTTLDRWPDKNGNYEPGNCRWATPNQQARNTRRSKLDFDTAKDIAIRMLSGGSAKEISIAYGISESLPREIAKGRAWKDALCEAKKLIGENR